MFGENQNASKNYLVFFYDYLVALRKLLRVESVISVNLYYITVL